MPKINRTIEITRGELRDLIIKAAKNALSDLNVADHQHIELCDIVLLYDGGTQSEALNDGDHRIAVTIELP